MTYEIWNIWKNEFQLLPYIITKINLRYIIIINVKPKIIKLVETTYKNVFDYGYKQRCLDGTQKTMIIKETEIN